MKNERIKIKVPAFEFEAVVREDDGRDFIDFEIDTYNSNLKEVLREVMTKSYRKCLKNKVKGKAKIQGHACIFPNIVWFYKD